MAFNRCILNIYSRSSAKTAFLIARINLMYLKFDRFQNSIPSLNSISDTKILLVSKLSSVSILSASLYSVWIFSYSSMISAFLSLLADPDVYFLLAKMKSRGDISCVQRSISTYLCTILFYGTCFVLYFVVLLLYSISRKSRIIQLG